MFDKLCLFGIVWSVIGSVKIMEPLCEVVAHFGIFLVQLPDIVPRLVGLIFACHKAPIVATDIFKIK